MRVREKRLERGSRRGAGVERGQEGGRNRSIRRGRLLKRSFMEGRKGRWDLRRRRQRQKDLADAALLRVVTVRNRVAGRCRFLLDGPKAIEGRGPRVNIVTSPALAGCCLHRLSAFGQVREPDRARRLKGKDTD